MTNQFEEVELGQSKEMPAKVVLYGVPKIGKSRFAAQADDVFFLNIEGGLDYLGKKVRSTPKIDDYDTAIGWLKHILDNDKFTAGTIAVDSLDWLESLARAKIEKQHEGKSISDQSYKPFSYGAGIGLVADATIMFLRGLDAVYKKKGIKALVIAHSRVRHVDLPNQDPYSRHELKVSKDVSAKVNEWADLILFADYSFSVSKDGVTSEPVPVLLTGGSAAFVGGGRMQLNKQIPLDYNQLKTEITK